MLFPPKIHVFQFLVQDGEPSDFDYLIVPQVEFFQVRTFFQILNFPDVVLCLQKSNRCAIYIHGTSSKLPGRVPRGTAILFLP